MLINAINEYNIYNNCSLKNKIVELENKYNITDESKFFEELVNFSRNREMPYHGWFKYREGYSSALIKELIKRSGIDSKNEYILDPFCGSGTTVLEAALNGISAVGIDINPMSAFISNVKCTEYNDIELEAIEKFVNYFSDILSTSEPSEEYLQRYDEVKKFFNEESYNRLVCIKEIIDNIDPIKDKKIHNLFLCAYICIVEEVSNRKRDGNGLKTLPSKIKDVDDYYINKIIGMINDIKVYRIETNVVSNVESDDAKNLFLVTQRNNPKLGKTLGVIIYSPPYANSFDYFESYKMEIILGDYAKNMKGIGIYREKAVESFIGQKSETKNSKDYIGWLADEIEEAIPLKEALTGKKDNRTRKVPKMIKGYFSDMEKVISESSLALCKGKKCYIVVDQSSYLGKIVPTDLFLADISEEYGFKVNDIIICRHAKTSAQQIKKYPYLGETLRESIVILEKI